LKKCKFLSSRTVTSLSLYGHLLWRAYKSPACIFQYFALLLAFSHPVVFGKPTNNFINAPRVLSSCFLPHGAYLLNPALLFDSCSLTRSEPNRSDPNRPKPTRQDSSCLLFGVELAGVCVQSYLWMSWYLWLQLNRCVSVCIIPFIACTQAGGEQAVSAKCQVQFNNTDCRDERGICIFDEAVRVGLEIPYKSLPVSKIRLLVRHDFRK